MPDGIRCCSCIVADLAALAGLERTLSQGDTDATTWTCYSCGHAFSDEEAARLELQCSCGKELHRIAEELAENLHPSKPKRQWRLRTELEAPEIPPVRIPMLMFGDPIRTPGSTSSMTSSSPCTDKSDEIHTSKYCEESSEGEDDPADSSGPKVASEVVTEASPGAF